jgi:hypothetical protein
MTESEALHQITHGLNNLHAAFLAHQSNSERRWASLDEKLDRHYSELYAKVGDVCDRGGQEHSGFKAHLHALELRMAAQEARNVGRADILKPAAEFVAKNWVVILFALYVVWDEVAQPALARAASPRTAEISGAL